VGQLEADRVRLPRRQQQPTGETLHRRVEAVAQRRLRELVHDALRVIHQQLVQRAAREDVLADHQLGNAISQPWKLDHQAVRERLVAERVGNSCHPLAADERDLDRAAAARRCHERHDPRLDEVRVVGDGARMAKHQASLQWKRLEFSDELVEDTAINL